MTLRPRWRHERPSGPQPQGAAKMTQLYDAIGLGYGHYRRPDPRLATAVLDARGDAATVVNVGAGAGSMNPWTARWWL